MRELELEHCNNVMDVAEMKRLLMRNSRNAWQTLEQDRDAMRRWKRFVDMEEEAQRRILDENVWKEEEQSGVDGRVRGLWKKQPEFVKRVVEEVEREIGGLQEEGAQTRVRLPHAMARLVGHTVAHWHSVRHWSEGCGEERVMVIVRDSRRGKREPGLLHVLGETR